jgi:cytochrome c553
VKRIGALVLGVACFALGAAVQKLYDVRFTTQGPQGVQTTRVVPPGTPGAAPAGSSSSSVPIVDEFDRSKIDFSKEPLWAWGRTEPPRAGDKAAPQPAPTGRRLRPNEDPEAQQRMRHLDGSSAEYSLVDIRDAVNVVDWFPQDHPNPIPDVVKHGPAALGEQRRACGSCHLADGKGRPENASPAGLPAAYILRQLDDFRNGLRHSADPLKANSNTMIMLAKSMSADEMKQAAEYFAAVPWTPHVQVVETNLVPRTRIQGDLFIATAKKRTEPIAGRIIEVPADEEQNEVLRSPRGSWIAYVPVGSIRKGKDLVKNGGMRIVRGEIVQGKTTACGTCHGLDLMGVPPDVPPIAGRSPSYLAREIFDIQQGARVGSNSNVKLMKMIVEKLTPEDIVNITAYLASRPVPGPTSRQLVAQR